MKRVLVYALLAAAVAFLVTYTYLTLHDAAEGHA